MSHSRLRLAGAAATALVAGVVLPAGLAAAATSVPLHSAHRGVTAAGFGSHDCAQIPGGAAPAGADGWVFVLPRNDADFLQLTLTYRSTAGQTVTVHIPDLTDPYRDGILANGASKAWVVLPSGWTLLDGSATVTGPTRAPFFNLTHTCPGTSPSPTTTPSASPTASASASVPASPTPEATATPTPEGSGGVAGTTAPASGGPSTPAPAGTSPGGAVLAGNSGGLPLTGTALGGVLLAGLVALAGGAALLVALRRRRVRFTSQG